MTSLIKSNGNGRNIFLPEFNGLFDDFFTRDLINFGEKLNTPAPAVNVKESENSFELEVAVPGMDKGDFKVEVKQSTLIVSAQKEQKEEDKNDKEKYLRKEFSFRSFTRSFILPEKTVDAENIVANYKDGILNISIPKKEKEKESVKQIQIG